MNKPYLTAKQIERVETIKSIGLEAEAILKHATKGYDQGDSYTSLKDLALLDFVDALRVGYRVAPTYRIGEWVVTLSNEAQNRWTRKVAAVHTTCIELEGGISFGFDEVRQATIEEIQKEELRRAFEKMGRKAIVLHEGDVVEYEGQFYVLRNELPKHQIIQGKFISSDHAYQMLMVSKLDSIHPVEASYHLTKNVKGSINFNEGGFSNESTI